MPEKDGSFWTMIAGSLAAIGAYLRYYIANRAKAMTRLWWRNALIDVTASTFIGIIVFLLFASVIGETAAAGLGGFAGHIGARETVLLLQGFLKKK